MHAYFFEKLSTEAERYDLIVSDELPLPVKKALWDKLRTLREDALVHMNRIDIGKDVAVLGIDSAVV